MSPPVEGSVGGGWAAKWLKKGFFVVWKDSVRCYIGVPYPIPIGAALGEADILTALTVQEMDQAIDQYCRRG